MHTHTYRHCNCGGIYEVIENEVPIEGPDSDFPNVPRAGRELRWIGPHPQFHHSSSTRSRTESEGRRPKPRFSKPRLTA